jgi:predicted metal-dependent hydrolase
MNLELNELEAITNQQSTTLYLIQREVEARETKLNLSQREIAIRPIRNDSIPFTPYDPDAKPEDAIAMAQQATHNISHYIEETENELFSKRYQPSC